MKNYEFSLVVFTTLSQMAVGLAVLAAWQGKSRGASPDAYKVWGLITLIMGVALGASLFHLGHPLRAYTTLANLGVAWLSAEILLGGLFAACAALAFLNCGKVALSLLAALLGVAFVAVQGFTYAPVAQSAIANGVPMALFALTAWTLGAAVWLCVHNVWRSLHLPGVAALLRVGLWLWLLLTLLVPCVWFAGGAVMRATASGWMMSWMYWAALACHGLVLVLLYRKEGSSAFVAPLLLLCGAVLGRLVFFAETASTFTRIGSPF